MKPCKIALVANTTWNIYNFRLNIIRKLLDDGHEVIVMAPVDKYISYQEKFHEIKHIPLKKLKRDSVNPLRDLQLTMELSALYKEHRPDIVVHYTVKPNIYGGLAAHLRGIPSIAIVTGLGYAFIHNGLVKKTTTSLYKWTSQFHSKFIFENEDDCDLFVNQGLIKREKGLTVNGCGVNTEYYKKEQNGRAGDETVFTFIGRLLYDKGLREFIEAAHLVKTNNANAKFWIIGELDKQNPSAIHERDLIKWVKDETIVYHGSTENVRRYLQESDCLVLPSYREGMSRVIMEAMSMERPVITTDTPGCRQAIDHGGNGYLVPVRDSKMLAEAMQTFLNLPIEERKAMGVNGRAKAIAQFDEKIIAGQISDVINDVLREEGDCLED
jgi:glycosyltransferase involved in cell wall biosynthesis